MLYPSLWAYRTNVKTATGFSPFQLVHGVEVVTPIECEMLYPSLWAYRTNGKTATGFSPFQLVHGVEVVTPIELNVKSHL